MKNWKLQKVDHTLTNKLASDLNVSKDIAKLLILRGVDSFIAAKNFFRPDLKNVHDPFLMKGMKEAVNRINRAKSQNESILLFGDYDVDGTSAVSMMYTFFKDQNINVILISHNIEQAFMLSDKFFIIKNGDMIEQFEKDQTSVNDLRKILEK